MKSIQKLDSWYAKEKKKLFDQFLQQHIELKSEYDKQYSVIIQVAQEQFFLSLTKRRANLYYVTATKKQKLQTFDWPTLQQLNPTTGASLVIKGKDINKVFMVWSKRDNSLTPPIDHMAAGWRFATAKLREKYQHLIDINII